MPIMNKSGLVDAIASKTSLPSATVAQVIDELQETVMSEVASGTDVKLLGFLAIERVTRSERLFTNPKTGEQATVPEVNAVKVRAMKNFRDRVRESE